MKNSEVKYNIVKNSEVQYNIVMNSEVRYREKHYIAGQGSRKVQRMTVQDSAGQLSKV